jgi:hypothetical protein
VLPGLREENLPRATPEEIPALKRSFPAPVTSLHQIEIASYCNLACPYCPNHRMERGDEGFRPTLFMTELNFARALAHAEYFVDAGTQVELNLAGIGESTMHPCFEAFVDMARELLGPKITLTLATNGLIANETLAECFKRNRVDVYVSLHQMVAAGKASALYAEYGVLKGNSTDPALNAMDWGGQVTVKTKKQWYAAPCQWLRQGFVMAMADGRLTACCLDAKADGVVGHVDDPLGSLTTRPYKLCATCHQHVKCEGYEQRSAA